MNAISQIIPAKQTGYVVRFANYDEREVVVRLYIDNLWHIAHLPPDMNTVVQSVFQSLYQGRVIVVERAGEIVGCTSFVEGTYWYSPQKCLFDTGAFVVKQYRKTRVGKLLLDELVAEAKRRNAVVVIGAGTKDETVAPMWAKRYLQIGSSFLVTA